MSATWQAYTSLGCCIEARTKASVRPSLLSDREPLVEPSRNLLTLPDSTDTTFVAVNSPTNYAGQTGSVNAVSGPPAVPDGTRGTTPLTVSAGNPDASSLLVSFDTRSCTNAADYHILYGERRNLPAAPGGTFSLLGSVCGIGGATPYTWAAVPQAQDGSGLIWFLVVSTDASGVEGSWGVDSSNKECVGPGNGGASGICAVVKSVANTCGHS